MGNYFSAFICRPSDIAVVGKVILRDGTIQEFSWPLTVAELMLEHPQQVVVEYHAAVNEKKPVPLPADHKLHVAKVYVMLPVKQGKPTTLSSEEARRVLGKGNGRERLEEVGSSTELIPESMEGRVEYMNRQYSAKGWKPSLDTIKEKQIETKVPHWLF
ncbi:uncharacterized protein LOC105762457 isoform X2 [Gossypium raimondii]|uniref:Uncharacterized protein n=1 Tax=Gossypium raimondii TaxID=29730 RepID=A0A0D2RF33_GOSRA|nr:uncharacterized protein LOC105762457 isoform X2 [Gossypium raimondii]KJB49843.1 hypothetical protein B456_008G140500 [Gossypium raimondii]